MAIANLPHRRVPIAAQLASATNVSSRYVPIAARLALVNASARYVPIAALLASVIVVGCQAEAEERTEVLEQHISFADLPTVTIAHERGATLLTSNSEDLRHSSIIIRGVRFGDRNDRDQESVTTATGVALKAMPGAKVGEPTVFEHPLYDAIRFDV